MSIHGLWLTNVVLLGPLARIGPNHLVTEDVDLLRHMSAARSVYTRSDWYDGMKLDPNINNVISERNDQRHTALRAKMAAGVCFDHAVAILLAAKHPVVRSTDYFRRSIQAKRTRDWRNPSTIASKTWSTSSGASTYQPARPSEH